MGRFLRSRIRIAASGLSSFPFTGKRMEFEFGYDLKMEKGTVLVEADSGVVHTFFAMKIAEEAARKQQSLLYFTPRRKEEVLKDFRLFRIPDIPMLEVRSAGSGKDLPAEYQADLCIIEKFSTLFAEAGTGDLMRALTVFSNATQARRIFILVSDAGILPQHLEKLLRASVDGVIQFLETAEGERIRRYIRIPKMPGFVTPDRMLPFTLTEEGIRIDPRERHR